MTRVEVKIQRQVGTPRVRRVLNAKFRDLRLGESGGGNCLRVSRLAMTWSDLGYGKMTQVVKMVTGLRVGRQKADTVGLVLRLGSLRCARPLPVANLPPWCILRVGGMSDSTSTFPEISLPTFSRRWEVAFVGDEALASASHPNFSKRGPHLLSSLSHLPFTLQPTAIWFPLPQYHQNSLFHGYQ